MELDKIDKCGNLFLNVLLKLMVVLGILLIVIDWNIKLWDKILKNWLSD